ncbi:MAG: DUF441 domain-containing protein [Pelosinus sp.]|nr:DUF441 domain-containing protein [Pelosinus sp.]
MNLDNLPILIIIVLSVIGNNQTVSVAAMLLLLIKLLGFDAWFPFIESHGINIGIIILTMAVLAPIAGGRIDMDGIVSTFKSSPGLIAVVVGIFVAWVAGRGVPFMKDTPEAVTALVVGTIVGVCFFRGLAVGPLIAGGLVSIIVSGLELFKK